MAMHTLDVLLPRKFMQTQPQPETCRNTGAICLLVGNREVLSCGVFVLATDEVYTHAMSAVSKDASVH